HLDQIKWESSYYIEATFIFKQLELIIILVYLSPNNREITKLVQQKIITKVVQGSQRNQYIII
ncbi:21940_t:CDS:1, partial [Gigaspora margarita]